MKYKIFDYTWHISHQFDMAYALHEDCNFYHCLNQYKKWDYNRRPKPSNVEFVTHYEPGKYDFALLHIDQECFMDNSLKQLVYTQFAAVINDIPKIVINHGSPVNPEYFAAIGGSIESKIEMEQFCIAAIKKLVGDNTMVVNSYTAAREKEWGFGIPIIHGINPSDWWDRPKEPRVFTALETHGLDTYYNRECMFNVFEVLQEKYGHTLAYATLNISTEISWENYRDYLGRSLLYLDTSFRTPMNRARTEAFLSGCCVLQVVNGHDLERWAVDGENIVLVPDNPEEISAIITDFIENNYEEAIRIGKNGKQMAIKEFSPDRFRKQWIDLLKLSSQTRSSQRR